MTSPTFHCSFCGAPITGSSPGATFTCPYCQSKVVAPLGGPAGGPVSSARGWDDAPARDAGPFSGGGATVAITIDPQRGPIALGAHAPHGQPPCLRAWDLKNKRALWEELKGQSWVERVDREGLAVRGHNVYVANKRQLLCLDLASGARRWVASLSDTPVGADYGPRGLMIADPFPPPPHGQRGAILVPTIDHQLFAFDRDSGQALWQRSFGDKEVEVEPVATLGACVVRYGSSYVKVDIVNPAFPQPIASLGHDHWSTDLGRATLFGRTVLTVVDDMGADGDTDGLFCFDAVSGQAHFFDAIDDLETDVTPAAMGSRAFAATSSGEGLYVGPRGRVVPPPVPNHTIAALVPAGPTLVLLLRKAHGTPVRRVVGIDPATLAFRFDAGEAGSEPDDDFDDQIASDGYSAVFVASPNDDEDECELRSIDTTSGRRLWSRPVGRWEAHRFVGGQLVVWANGGVEVLSPQNGQVVGGVS